MNAQITGEEEKKDLGWGGVGVLIHLEEIDSHQEKPDIIESKRSDLNIYDSYLQ